MYVLLAAAVASFPGGNYNDLAKSISEATTKPAVVVLSSAPRPIKPFEFNHADLDAMASAFRTNAELMMSPGVNLILHDGLIPADKVSKGRSPRGSATPKAFPETAVANGVVTFSTEKTETLQLESLKGFSKPVEVHWFYTDQIVGVSAKGVPELDFLNHIARGMGAKVVNTTKSFKIDFDPVEVRTRAIRTIQADNARDAKTPRDPMETFRIAALNSLTPATLTELFSKPRNQVRTPIRPGSDIERQAVALLRQQSGPQPQRDARTNTGVIFENNRRAATIFDRVDTSRQARLVTDTSFTSWVEVPVRGGNGNSYETVLRPESRRISRRGGG